MSTMKLTTPNIKCKYCGSIAKDHRVCHGGQCPHCQKICKIFVDHRCPLVVLEDFTIARKVLQCENCKETFMYADKMRIWKKYLFCEECIDIHEIHTERGKLRDALNIYFIATNQRNCEFCDITFFDQNDNQIKKYDLDHRNCLTKQNTVGKMVIQGFPILEIIEEAKSCRLLCKACHDAVTCVERNCEIYSYKSGKDQLPLHLQATVIANIDIAAKKLRADQKNMLENWVEDFKNIANDFETNENKNDDNFDDDGNSFF